MYLCTLKNKDIAQGYNIYDIVTFGVAVMGDPPAFG